MRKIAIVIFLLIASKYWCYSQVDSSKMGITDEVTYKPVLTKEYFIKKSVHRNTEGWVFLGLGVALFTTGAILNNQEQENGFVIIPRGLIFQFGGVISTFASIPFFISAYNNSHKALQY